MRNSNLNAALCWKMEKLQLLLPTLPRMRALSAQTPEVDEELGAVDGHVIGHSYHWPHHNRKGAAAGRGNRRLRKRIPPEQPRPELPPWRFNETQRANSQRPAEDRTNLPGHRLFATLEACRGWEKEGDDTAGERFTFCYLILEHSTAVARAAPSRDESSSLSPQSRAERIPQESLRIRDTQTSRRASGSPTRRSEKS